MAACNQPVEERVLFDVHNDAQVAVVRCSGRIVLGDGTDDLLRAVMAQESPHIQIDLSRVNAIDAGGLGVLVRLERWARDMHRSLELINPTRRICEALETTGLTSVLHIRSTRGRGEVA